MNNEHTIDESKVLGPSFYDAWKLFPRKADDLFQVPWFSDMWKTVKE